MKYRIEKDTMGELQVPREKLYGAQTARAVANFPISFSPIDRDLIQALGLIKKSAAAVNRALGLLEPPIAGRLSKPPMRWPPESWMNTSR